MLWKNASPLLTMIVLLVFSGPLCAGIVTWDAGGDGETWSDRFNWSGDEIPQDTDDVEHHLGDTIRFDLGSLLVPLEIIKSFTGSGGGTLIIEQGKGLQVTGDFTNADGTADTYALTMEPNSLLELHDDTAGDADLSHVNVTMQPVPSGDPAKLLIDGAIIGGNFDIGESNIVEAGRVSGAAKSVLWGEWTILDGAEVLFDREMWASNDASLPPLEVTIEGGSTLTIDEADYGGYTIEDAMGDIGLVEDDWDDFLHYVANGTQTEQDNYLCWMAHYIECHAPGETCNGTNCTNDPFGGHQ